MKNKVPMMATEVLYCRAASCMAVFRRQFGIAGHDTMKAPSNWYGLTYFPEQRP
jgi:hypothetical protein